MKILKKYIAALLIIIMCLTSIPFCKNGLIAEATIYKVGDLVAFGSYPQSQVKDAEIVEELNALTPDWEDWNSYGYYSSVETECGVYNNVPGDWMRYIDVVYKKEKYRGVKFIEYRPYGLNIYNSGEFLSNQYENGYYTNIIYWFKFEPIIWRILDPNTGLVICETIIDAQEHQNEIYYDGYCYYSNASCTTLHGDYETSFIRKWLNDDFYNTAFTDVEKKKIETSTLNNDGYNTVTGNAGYIICDSKETNDKMFLLSYNEAQDSAYGFGNPDYYDPNFNERIARRAKGSDYAKCQGLYVEYSGEDSSCVENQFYGLSCWFLRTPGNNGCGACYVTFAGGIAKGGPYGYTPLFGTRPAFRFKEITKYVTLKYSEATNPTTPTYFITPKAIDGGLLNDTEFEDCTAIYNYGVKEFSERFVIERSKIISSSGAESGNVTIKADDYRDCIIPNEVLKNISYGTDFPNYYATTAYMQLERNNAPYISTVYARNGIIGDYADIRVSANKIHCSYFQTQDIIVSVGGLSNGETVSKVVLLQSDEEKFESSDGYFRSVNLASKFEENKEIYVYAVIHNDITNEDRTTAPEELKIDIELNNQIGDGLNNILSMDLLGNDGQSFGLDVDVPFLKDSKISFDALKTPVGISKDGDVWKISIGVDIFSVEEDSGNSEFEIGGWEPFKKQINEIYSWLEKKDDNLVDSYESALDKFNEIKNKFGDEKKLEEYINSNKRAELDFNFGVLGYIEGTYIDGKWTTIGSKGIGGGVIVNFKAEKTVPISIYGFPCYWGLGGGFEGKAIFEGTRSVASKKLPIATTFVLGYKPIITGKFGAGVDKLLYAELNGEGTMPIEFRTSDKYFKAGLAAQFGWEAGIWILTADGVIWESDEPVTIFERYFNIPSRVTRSFAMDYPAKSAASNSNSEPEVSIISRDYAETTSEWLYGEPKISTFALRDYVQQGVTFTDLQQSVFTDSKLQMVQVGNDTFATWIEDDTSRDTYNRMRLVYSVRNGDTGLWSEPKAVWDTGVNDGYPSVATDGEKVYITWQKVNKVIKESDCVEATVFYNNGEICLAEYDINTDKIVSSKTITDNNYYDYSPVVMVNNSKPVVFWTSSEDNNMTAMDGCNFNRYSDGTTTILLEGISSPITVSAEVIDGKENISYCTDTDGNFETTEDITVNTYVDGTVTTFDKGENSLAIKDAKYGNINGESVLFMQDGTNIFYEDGDETVYVFDVDRNIDGNFSIVEAINGTQLIWTEKDVNGSSNIFSCVYSDNVWSDPVKVSENDKYITNLVAVCANGKIIGGCNRTEVTYNEETQITEKGLTDLSYWSMADFSDVEIELFSYKEKNFIESGSNSFDLHVSNNGSTNIEEIEFVIEDTLGNSTTVTKEVNLISGEAQTVEVPYTPAENYTATTLTVTANIPNDVDEENNTTSFEVGSSDVVIEVGDVVENEDCFDISALVSNISLIDAENVKLSIYANSEVGEAIETFDIGNIPASSISDAYISIREEAVDFNDSGVGLVYLKLTASDEINIINNNICVPLILEKEKECGHPLTETVEGKAPTCTEEGTSDYEVCVVCGEPVTESKVVLAKHSFDDWYFVLEPTCQNTGEGRRDCLDCDYYETESIPLSDHDYILTSTSTTCLEDGYETYLCSYGCGETYTEFHSAYGHNYFWSWFEEIPASCNEDGLKWTFCLRCRVIKEQIIPKLEHEDNDGDGACDKCGYNDDAPDIPEHSHSYNVSVTLVPSCETKGIKKFSCDCGDTYTEEIAALGHKEVIDESVESSCSGFGLTEGRHCELCGKVIIKQDVIAKKDHNFDGSKCKNCGYDKSEYCSCNCHKGGIAGFFFKIILFFQKIFKTNQICEGCGIKHY